MGVGEPGHLPTVMRFIKRRIPRCSSCVQLENDVHEQQISRRSPPLFPPPFPFQAVAAGLAAEARRYVAAGRAAAGLPARTRATRPRATNPLPDLC